KNPNHLAVTDGINHLHYKQLDDLSNRLAHFLLKNNIKIGEPIIILMERTPAILVAMMAIFKIGAIYVPINPKYPDERIQYILSDCKPNIILTNNKNRIPVEYLHKTQILDDEYKLLMSCSHQKI